MDDITRVCRKCGQEKPLSEFVKDKTRALGYSYTCKHCKRQHARKYRADNHEKVLERTHKWRFENPGKVREYSRKYYAENREKILEYDHKYYAENAEKRREYARKWCMANPEKVRELGRKHRKELYDCHLRSQLKKCNLPITPETIDYKRIQLKLYREIKKQTDYERN